MNNKTISMKMRMFLNLKNSRNIVNVEACKNHACECLQRLSIVYREKAIPKEEYKKYKRCFDAQRFKPSHDYFYIP